MRRKARPLQVRGNGLASIIGLDRRGHRLQQHLHLHAPELPQVSTTPAAAHAASMAAENTPDEPRTPARDPHHVDKAASEGKASAEHDSDDEDDEAEEEPKLKYSRLTRDLGPVYRNGDATATFMVAGDKMVRS